MFFILKLFYKCLILDYPGKYCAWKRSHRATFGGFRYSPFHINATFFFHVNGTFLFHINGRAGEPEPEPGVFGSLEPEPLEKKNEEPEPEPLGKKSQEPEPVKISRLLSPARR